MSHHRTRTPRRRSLSVLAAVSLGAGILLSANAAQADVYSNGEIDPSGSVYESSGACAADYSTTGQTSVPLVENAGPATNTASLHNVSTSTSDPTDSVTQDLSDTTTAQLTSSGSNIAAMHFASTGNAGTTQSLTTTTCDPHAYIQNEPEFDFTVTTPGYLNVTFAQQGPAYVEFEIEGQSGQDAYYDIESEYTTASSTHSFYLPAGDYEGYYESEPYTRTGEPNFNGANTSSQVDATFTPDGTPKPTPPATGTKGLQATPSVGKGLGYASLPLARSCATGTLVENVTSSKSAAKSIEKVTVFVDGVKALTVKNPKAGQAITVPLADTGKARTVQTVVTTAKGKHHTKHHKHAHKKFASVSSYQPCS